MTTIRDLIGTAAVKSMTGMEWANVHADFPDRVADAIRAALKARGLVIVPREPSKAQLIGEFKFHREVFNEDGGSYSQEYFVPWTTIKEIIAAHLAASPYWEGE